MSLAIPITLNLFVDSFKYSIAEQMIKKLKNRSYLNDGNYSIIFYSVNTPPRIKLEMFLNEKTPLSFISKTINRQISKGIILSWEIKENDTPAKMWDKCKATKIRESFNGWNSETYKETVSWKIEIKKVIDDPEYVSFKNLPSVREYFLKEFLHFIMNPLSYETENKIRGELNLPKL